MVDNPEQVVFIIGERSVQKVELEILPLWYRAREEPLEYNFLAWWKNYLPTYFFQTGKQWTT